MTSSPFAPKGAAVAASKLKVYRGGDSTGVGRLSGLYMGDALTGKSHCLGTWPNPLVVAFDPDTQTIRNMPGVYVIEVGSWAEFENHIMPYVRNRGLGRLVMDMWEGPGKPTEEPLIETLGVDTISIGSMKLAEELQGAKKRLDIQDFGAFLNKLVATTMQCVETTKESFPGQATYNVIFTAHLNPVNDDTGTLIAVRPAVMGQFKEILPRLFGFSFICQHGIENVLSAGKAMSVERFTVRTVPKSDQYVCGDRIGGKGPYRRLPPVTGGTYPELMEAWGISGTSK